MKWRLPIVAFATVAIVLGAFTLWNGRDRDPPCESRDFEGSRFTVCRLDTRRHEMRLVSRDGDGAFMRDFEAVGAFLGRDERRVRFAMNAGMFNDAGAPIGLYVENGEERHPLRLTDGPGNFHMKPNGVFWQDRAGLLHVDASEDYAAAAPTPRFATQSGPMLLIRGELHPRFAHDGESRNVRNGVAVCDPRTAYFVISGGVVSFGRFARFIRDDLGCPDALFFDGTVSSLWAPRLNRRDRTHQIGPMIVVLDRR